MGNSPGDHATYASPVRSPYAYPQPKDVTLNEIENSVDIDPRCSRDRMAEMLRHAHRRARRRLGMTRWCTSDFSQPSVLAADRKPCDKS